MEESLSYGGLDAFGCNREIYSAWQHQTQNAANMQLDMKLGRVVADFGTSLTIAVPEKITAELTGKLAHYSKVGELLPKVGDWVSAYIPSQGNAVIESVVPRLSEVARKAPGNRTAKQVIAANVDVAFVLLALDDDFSVERLKRFLYQLSINNIRAVIVLNKADKTDDIAQYQQQLISFALPVVVTNALTGLGIDTLLSHIKPGQTAVLLGSSGVGKSSVTNQLLGRDVQATQAIRESDSSGKHTTVHRELFVLPNGGLLIDTPGIRELQLWGTQDDLNDEYNDVAALIAQCKYTTCQHGAEDGCAVRPALESGTLSKSRYAGYQKMQRELKTLSAQKKVLKQLHNKRSPKKLRQQARDSYDDIQQEIDELR
jgi:ribosome biogenesis GTPase